MMVHPLSAIRPCLRLPRTFRVSHFVSVPLTVKKNGNDLVGFKALKTLFQMKETIWLSFMQCQVEQI